VTRRFRRWFWLRRLRRLDARVDLFRFDRALSLAIDRAVVALEDLA
jgi:hypothetical protein